MIPSSTTDTSLCAAILILLSILAIPLLWTVTLVHLVYISKKYAAEMKASIKSSPELSAAIRVYDSMGLSRKILIPGMIYNAVSQRRSISIGLISPGDVANFPNHLKVPLRRDSLLHRISLIWTFSVYVILTIIDSPGSAMLEPHLQTEQRSFSSIFEMSTWSKKTWLLMIGLGFLALVLTPRVMERISARDKINTHKSEHNRISGRHSKSFDMEKALIIFSIAWIFAFIILKETIGSH